MACQNHEKQLFAYFDRELDASGREDFMGHLRECGDCRWDFKLYRKMFQVMERMEVDPPSDLPGLVMQGVRKLTLLTLPMAGRLRVLSSPATYGLAAAAVFMVAVMAGWQTRPVDPRLPTAQALMTPGNPAPGLTTRPIQVAQGPIRVLPEGQVEIMRRGSARWEPARSSDRIGYEDRIRTGEGSSVRLEYPDRAYLKIRPRSLVQVLDEAVRVFQGDAWIKVQKRGSRFEARTPNAVASVRGTIYSVHVTRLELDREHLLQVAREGSSRATLGSAVGPVGSNAPLSAAETPLRMAAYLRKAFVANIRTEVKVFESVVAVSAVDPETGEPLVETLVQEGNGTQVEGMQVASLKPLHPQDYYAWNLPPPPQVMTARRTLPVLPETRVDGATGDAVKVDAPVARLDPPTTLLGSPVGDSAPVDDEMSAGAAPRPGMNYEGLRSR